MSRDETNPLYQIHRPSDAEVEKLAIQITASTLGIQACGHLDAAIEEWAPKDYILRVREIARKLAAAILDLPK